MIWSRPVVAPNAAVAIPLTGGLAELSPPLASAGASASVGDGAVGVISNVTLADVALDTDLKPVMTDLVNDPVLQWSVPSGQFDYYIVILSELLAANLQTYEVYVDQITTVQPQLSIRHDLLQPYHEYVFTIIGVLGTPGAADGDFTTSAFPAGYEVYVPGTFVTQLPQPGP